MLQQKLISLSSSRANKYFDINDNLFPMDFANPIMLNSESNDKCMGSSLSFCFELDSSLLNEIKDNTPGKIFQWTFEVAGISWSLGIFPFGINMNHNGFTSIFLYRKPVDSLIAKREVSTYFSFDYDSGRVYKHNFANGHACGHYKWGESKCSKISGRFVMLYSFEECCQPLSNMTIGFKNTIPKNTDVLFTKPYDIELKGKGWTFYFHSEFLSAKSKFVPTLQKDNAKTQELQTINIPDISSSLMKSIISFIINGRIQLKVESILNVCNVATCLGLTDLKLACEFIILFSHLTSNNVLKVLAVAYNSDLKMVKYECFNHMLINFNSILLLPDWEILRLNNPNALLDITNHLLLTKFIKIKPDNRFCQCSEFIGDSSSVLSCSKIVLNAYDFSNEEVSAVIVKLAFEIPVNELNKINSFSFQAEETKWSLRILTDNKNKDYTSIFLCNRSIGEASVDFMLDCDQDIAYFHKFSGGGNWGVPKWKLTSDIKGGLLTINFVMRQRKQALQETENGKKTNSIYRFCQPFYEIHQLNFITPYDILLIGEGWEYNVHRELLTAQSPVFAAMFSYDTKENKEKIININDISSVTMKAILSFIYTGTIDICDKTAIDICAAADKYLLEPIKLACEHVLCNNMTVETLSERYICAEMYNLAILKSTCIHFIIKNVKAVTQTEGWIDLTSQPTIAEKLLLTLNALGQC